MSATLLQRVKTHIIDDGGLLGSYGVRYYRWLDNDLNQAGGVVRFRTVGAPAADHVVQFVNVLVELLAARDGVKSADDDMLGVIQYLRANYRTTGAFLLKPQGTYTGPVYLQNGRAMFEATIRCGVTDH